MIPGRFPFLVGIYVGVHTTHICQPSVFFIGRGVL